LISIEFSIHKRVSSVREESLCQGSFFQEHIHIINGMTLNLIKSGKSWTVVSKVNW
jgi:hypothetical protein